MEDGSCSVVPVRPLLTSTVNMTDDSILGASEGAFDLTQASSVGEVDAWIESLMACKQLSEVDVKKLCDKVCSLPVSHDRACARRMSC